MKRSNKPFPKEIVNKIINRDLTKKVKDGQIVKMDAGNGIVYLKSKDKRKD